MAENSEKEIPEAGSFNQSEMMNFESSQNTQINYSSISLGLQQSYEQNVSGKQEEKEHSNSHFQGFKQSLPFSVVMSTISQKDSSMNQTFSIHKYNAQLQEEDFLPSNLPELQRIKQLQEQVEALKLENKELQKKVGKAGAQNGVSFESMNDQIEEENGAMQSNQTEVIDYKSKYLQYKLKCKYLMNKLAGLEAIISKKK